MGAGTAIRGATDTQQESWARQVSMSQRQQQQRAVQQAVRQVDGPRSSLLWSSTTYTGERTERRVRMIWCQREGLCSLFLLPTTSSSPSLKGTAFFLLGMNARTLQNDPKPRHCSWWTSVRPQSAKKIGSVVPCSTKVVGRDTPSDSAKPNRIQICTLKK